jgi:hypothetical protein
VPRPAADPREPLVGLWTGDSICTPVRPACHDEKAAYHVTLGERPDSISMLMNKIVNGKEEEMGTMEYTVDAAKKTLRGEIKGQSVQSVWEFSWSGSEMRGTATQLPSGEVIRNITLKKSK